MNGLRTRLGDNSGMQEIIPESRQPALKMARRRSLMHEGARYHALKKLSSPTALPACVSAGSPAKRGNMISWLFAQVSLLKRRMELPAHQTLFPNPSAEFPHPAPPQHKILPPQLWLFLPNLRTLHHTFCFRCPISLYSQFHSKGLSDNTTQSGFLSLLKINTCYYTKSRHTTTVPGNDFGRKFLSRHGQRIPRPFQGRRICQVH